MKRLAAAAAVSLMVAGCAHAPIMKQQVNRTAKSDKMKLSAKPDNPTPSQIVKNRWMPKFKIKWLHGK